MVKLTSMIGAACAAVALATPAFANTVKLDAQLGQTAVVAASGKHVYLRISLEGLVLAHDAKRTAAKQSTGQSVIFFCIPIVYPIGK